MGQSGGAILGVSADFHDASAAIVLDGHLAAAAEEERFTRRKHDPSLPEQAIRWCLESAGVEPGQLSQVVYYEKPLSAYDRILTSHALVGPAGFPTLAKAVRHWSTSKLWIGYRLERLLHHLGHPAVRVQYAAHHQSHAASAFYPSPYDRAAVLVVDGVGEWASSSLWWGSGHRLEQRAETRYPDSVGLFYSAMTAFCGFDVNDGEYKLMGLAPYGEPRYVDALRAHVIQVHDDGSIRLDQRWFGYRAGRRMTRSRLDDLLDGPVRRSDEPLDQRHADLARSTQVILEGVLVKMARHAHVVTGESALCLAGGVALNCVATERVLDDGAVTDIWTQPAAGDSGGAIGAALWTWHQMGDHPRAERLGADGMSGALLGPSFEHREIAAWLNENDVAFTEFDDEATLCNEIAARLAGGALVGWLQGRMEFGPRALGNRSILADPRDPHHVRRINELVKRREGFRPFAPAVLAEHAGSWFAIDGDRPYMTMTAPVHADQVRAGSAPQGRSFAEQLAQVRSTIPACTHVDGSSRVQTVHRETNPRFHALLQAFAEQTGCPVLVNTSFNLAGEPIVRTPADALRCFRASGLDVLVLERCVIHQPAAGGSVGEAG